MATYFGSEGEAKNVAGNTPSNNLAVSSEATREGLTFFFLGGLPIATAVCSTFGRRTLGFWSNPVCWPARRVRVLGVATTIK